MENWLQYLRIAGIDWTIQKTYNSDATNEVPLNPAKLQELNQIDVKLNQLQQQVDVDRQNYRLYLTKFEESRISDAMDTEKISSENTCLITTRTGTNFNNYVLMIIRVFRYQ